MRPVHGDESLAERAGPRQHRRWRRPVGLEARRVLDRLLRDVGVQGKLPVTGPLRDGRRRVRIDRADAVDRGADACAVATLELAHPLRPTLRVAVAEAALDLVELLADPAVEVAGVEQGDADPGLARGLDHGPAHRVRILVRRPTGTVVQVMELADAGDP